MLLSTLEVTWLELKKKKLNSFEQMTVMLCDTENGCIYKVKVTQTRYAFLQMQFEALRGLWLEDSICCSIGTDFSKINGHVDCRAPTPTDQREEGLLQPEAEQQNWCVPSSSSDSSLWEATPRQRKERETRVRQIKSTHYAHRMKSRSVQPIAPEAFYISV